MEEQEEEAEAPELGEANDVVAVVEVELEQVEEAEANDVAAAVEAVAPASYKTRQTRVAMRRLLARKWIDTVVQTMHETLVEQRKLFDGSPTDDAAAAAQVVPEGEIGGPDNQGAAAEELQRARAALSEHVNALAVLFQRARAAEKQTAPNSLDCPAVLAFAVSAPTSSWFLEDWMRTPVPLFAESMKKLFSAAYSNDNGGANKLKLRRPSKKIKRTRRVTPVTDP